MKENETLAKFVDIFATTEDPPTGGRTRYTVRQWIRRLLNDFFRVVQRKWHANKERESKRVAKVQEEEENGIDDLEDPRITRHCKILLQNADSFLGRAVQ